MLAEPVLIGPVPTRYPLIALDVIFSYLLVKILIQVFRRRCPLPGKSAHWLFRPPAVTCADIFVGTLVERAVRRGYETGRRLG